MFFTNTNKMFYTNYFLSLYNIANNYYQKQKDGL